MKQSIAIFLLLLSINAHAALNKWVDADGKVHYSDTAPVDVKVNKLRSSSAPDSVISASGVYAPKTLAEREAEWKKSQKSKEEAAQKEAKEQENAAIQQKNCESARSNLAAYEHSQRMVQYDANGERSFLDDAARTQKIEEARQSVSTYCK